MARCWHRKKHIVKTIIELKTRLATWSWMLRWIMAGQYQQDEYRMYSADGAGATLLVEGWHAHCDTIADNLEKHGLDLACLIAQ